METRTKKHKTVKHVNKIESINLNKIPTTKKHKKQETPEQLTNEIKAAKIKNRYNKKTNKQITEIINIGNK